MPGRCQFLVILGGIVCQLIWISEYFSHEGFVERPQKDQGKLSALPTYDLVIGVLSARGNHEQRQAIRDTWLGYIMQHPSLQEQVVVKFIIGSAPCLIPPLDRYDQYSCEPDPVTDPVLGKDIIAHRVPKGAFGQYPHQGPVGWDFRVNFPIVITQLGVFDSDSDGLENGLTIRLYDRISQVEVLSVNFTPEDPGELIGGNRFKSVDQYLLPKGFEGSIVAENFSSSDPGINVPHMHGSVDSGGGLVSFLNVSRFGFEQSVFPENEERFYEDINQYVAGTFMYRAYAAEDEFSKVKLEERRKQRQERKEMWQSVLQREQNELQREMSQYDDILLVDVVDVYRSLPRKLLKFYSWTVRSMLFNFTLKTDDDCFVNVDEILKALDKRKLQGKERIWWSRFRSNWAVERVGKWREMDYTAPVYPSFACGAGNILSADLVEWLALNKDHLKMYQGEDVSMGIWLSVLGPNIVNDYRWSCGRECDRGVFTSPENDPEELREMWSDLQLCGDPCGCSE
ncbi:Beta-1 [Porites harrisoni]